MVFGGFRRKAAYSLTITILLTTILVSIVNIQPVKASGTIYIRADGSIDPPTAPIQRDGDTYTLTDNIAGSSIVVERNNIILNGGGYILQGPGSYIVSDIEVGLYLSGRTGVTIENFEIRDFEAGIFIDWSATNNIIFGNYFVNNNASITVRSSSYNTINSNVILRSNLTGIFLVCSSNNNIRGNIIENNGIGIFIAAPPYDCKDNVIYHNDFISNTYQTHFIPLGNATNIWDNGYPSGGNYWSDYTGVDEKKGPNQDQQGSDAIGDIPYNINEYNIDRYPQITRNIAPKAAQLAIQMIGGAYNWGGKGWNWSLQNRERDWAKGCYLTANEMRNGYTCMYSTKGYNNTEKRTTSKDYELAATIKIEPKPNAHSYNKRIIIG
ncbi:MAG: NosD domain-containing protein [Candidatus Bathyarchaeia archaeon]